MTWRARTERASRCRRRPPLGRSESPRPRSRPYRKDSGRRRTCRSVPRTRCSASSRFRSPARPARLRRWSRSRGTWAFKTSPGGADTARMTLRNSSCARSSRTAGTAAMRQRLRPPRCSRLTSTWRSTSSAPSTATDEKRGHTPLMLEYAGSQRAGRRNDRSEGAAIVGILRSLDWLLLAGIAGLVTVGLWAVSGVTRFAVTGNPSYYLDRQMIYVAVGGAALVVGTFIDPDVYRRYWKPIFGGTVLLIAFVLLVGHAARGSTRWISLGFFTFQPSEFGKLAFVLALAGFMADRSRDAGATGTTIRMLGLGAIPVVLVFAQPDLGTALVYLAALTAMLFVGGVPWRQLAALGTIA